MTGGIPARRARRNKGVEPIRRETLQLRRLSFKARGCLGLCLSLPDEWEVHGVDGLAEWSDRDGREAVRGAIEELEEVGLFARLKRQGPRGKWEWLWTYSDDAGEVAEEVARWEEQGFRPSSSRRGGNRRAAGRPDQQRPPVVAEDGGPDQPGEASEPAVFGKPEDGAVSGFPVDGPPVHGSAVDGKPADIERDSRETPPNPPPSGGNQTPPGQHPQPDPTRCGHGLVHCRACRTSPRTRQRAEDDAAARAAREVAAECRRRGWCAVDGLVLDQGVPVAPATMCDHVTPPAVIVARIAAAEQTPAPAARAGARGPRPPSPDVRAAALAAAQPRRRGGPRATGQQGTSENDSDGPYTDLVPEATATG